MSEALKIALSALGGTDRFVELDWWRGWRRFPHEKVIRLLKLKTLAKQRAIALNGKDNC